VANAAPILQLASRGEWDRARTLPLPAPAAAVDELVEELLAEGPPDLAAELLWEGPPIVFVGARYAPHEAPELRQRLKTVAAKSHWDPAGALAGLASGPLGPPVAAELGAVNEWRAVGPLPIGLDADAADVREALAERPDLALCRRPVALELVLQHTPREAWRAVEVSSPGPDGHVVDPDRVVAALGA
jgi:hypothetical protein